MTLEVLRFRIEAVLADAELPRLGAGLVATVRIRCGTDALCFRLDDGRPVLVAATTPAQIIVAADEAAWTKVLQVPPPPTFHAFTAFALANPAFAIEGDPLLIAQARPVLERLFERVTASPALPAIVPVRDLTRIKGSYHALAADGRQHDLFVEQAGNGIPVLCLHTAGADARQFQAQLADVELGRDFRLVAPDLPFHGRSMPPRDWDGSPYRLTAATYLAWCVAVIEQVIGEPAIVAGGSMGAGMAMVMAGERPDLVRGIVAIEPPFQSKGRRNPFQHHVQVHGGLHNAAFVRGLMSPTSPEADRRRAAWIYSQGAPGIYPGDLAFYSDEFDGAVVAPRIDAAKTPVALLCGTYDYSATPADGAKLADLIPGARLTVMEGLGHFPMCENPDLFRPHFVAGLAHASGR